MSEEIPVDNEILEKMEPAMNTSNPGWTEHVLKELKDDEKVNIGGKDCPKVDGLRRLARVFLGEIVESIPDVIQSPNPSNGFVAVSSHRLKIIPYDVNAHPIVFAEVADVIPQIEGNELWNIDKTWGRFPTSIASTRAEARALRKALCLKNVVSAEEMAPPVTEIVSYGKDGKIADSQINIINILCKRINIDVMKFVNSGKVRYNNIEEVPYATAGVMVKTLNQYQNDPDTIPAKIMGYNKNWRDE